MIGMTELILILIIVILIFGAGKFPKIMENFAEGINVFKKTIKEDKNKNNKDLKKKKTTSSKKKKTAKSK
ncbi:MAG: twin-arginine translocase TatA/TatE family subunit [Alphaproteobacteria bacterium]